MDKLLGAYIWLSTRLREPSTHAALCGLAANIGFSIDTGVIHDLAVIASLGFGALGFWVKEAKPQTTI